MAIVLRSIIENKPWKFEKVAVTPLALTTSGTPPPHEFKIAKNVRRYTFRHKKGFLGGLFGLSPGQSSNDGVEEGGNDLSLARVTYPCPLPSPSPSSLSSAYVGLISSPSPPLPLTATLISTDKLVPLPIFGPTSS